jgi:hypothetical protein
VQHFDGPSGHVVVRLSRKSFRTCALIMATS